MLRPCRETLVLLCGALRVTAPEGDPSWLRRTCGVTEPPLRVGAPFAGVLRRTAEPEEPLRTADSEELRVAEPEAEPPVLRRTCGAEAVVLREALRVERVGAEERTAEP